MRCRRTPRRRQWTSWWRSTRLGTACTSPSAPHDPTSTCLGSLPCHTTACTSTINCSVFILYTRPDQSIQPMAFRFPLTARVPVRCHVLLEAARKRGMERSAMESDGVAAVVRAAQGRVLASEAEPGAQVPPLGSGGNKLPPWQDQGPCALLDPPPPSFTRTTPPSVRLIAAPFCALRIRRPVGLGSPSLRRATSVGLRGMSSASCLRVRRTHPCASTPQHRRSPLGCRGTHD